MAEACLDLAAGGNSTSLVSSSLDFMEAHSRNDGVKCSSEREAR